MDTADAGLKYKLPDGRTLTLGEFLTLLIERRAAEAAAEVAIHAAVKKLEEEA